MAGGVKDEVEVVEEKGGGRRRRRGAGDSHTKAVGWKEPSAGAN